MTQEERRINLAAQFLPMTGSDETADLALPCIEVGGVQVYAYFDEGVLRIAAHYDSAWPEVQAEDAEVPTEIWAGDTLVASL